MCNTQLPHDIFNLLMQLGLNSTDAQILLSASSLQEGTTREISIAARKERAQTHHTLVKLQQLGLIETTLSSPARFRPIELGEAIDRLYSFESERLRRLDEARKKVAKSLRPQSLSFSRSHRPLIESYSIVKGRISTYLKIIEAMQSSNNQVLIMLSAHGLTRFRRFENLMKTIRTRYRKGVQFKIISEVNSSNARDAKVLAKFCELRHVRNQFTNASTYDKIRASIALSLSESLDVDVQEHVTLWTNADSFVETLTNHFESIWFVGAPLDPFIKTIELEGQR